MMYIDCCCIQSIFSQNIQHFTFHNYKHRYYVKIQLIPTEKMYSGYFSSQQNKTLIPYNGFVFQITIVQIHPREENLVLWCLVNGLGSNSQSYVRALFNGSEGGLLPIGGARGPSFLEHICINSHEALHGLQVIDPYGALLEKKTLELRSPFTCYSCTSKILFSVTDPVILGFSKALTASPYGVLYSIAKLGQKRHGAVLNNCYKS